MGELHIIRKVWNTRKGKSGFGLSGFAVLWQLIRWAFEGMGVYQTMIDLLPNWMLSPLFPLLVFVSGVLLVLWAVYEQGHTKDSSELPIVKHETKGEHSPASSTFGSHSPVVNIFSTPPPASKPSQPSRPYREARKQHRIELIRIETRNVVGKEARFDDFEWTKAKNNEGNPFVVLFLRNSVGGASVFGVRAQIALYGVEGSELASCSNCCWLDNKSPLADFTVGDTLVLVVLAGGKDLAVIPWYRAVPYDDGGGSWWKLAFEEVRGQVKAVEINLISEEDEPLFRARLNYEFAKGKPALTMQQPSVSCIPDPENR